MASSHEDTIKLLLGVERQGLAPGLPDAGPPALRAWPRGCGVLVHVGVPVPAPGPTSILLPLLSSVRLLVAAGCSRRGLAGLGLCGREFFLFRLWAGGKALFPLPWGCGAHCHGSDASGACWAQTPPSWHGRRGLHQRMPARVRPVSVCVPGSCKPALATKPRQLLPNNEDSMVALLSVSVCMPWHSHAAFFNFVARQ